MIEYREDFPYLTSQPRLVYLDSASTTQKPRQVLEAISNFYVDHCANVHRGAYQRSASATDLYEGARETVAKFIGAADPSECIFTSGTTDGVNQLAHTWGRSNLKPGDRLVLSVMEHHSNLIPWQQVAQQQGAEIDWIEVTPSGDLDLASYELALQRGPKLVTFPWVSNVLGTVNPVAQMLHQAKQVGAITIIDGAQAVPHLVCDVGVLGCDFLVFSGHKLLGPTGVGLLWGRKAELEKLPPYRFGGSMIAMVKREKTTFAPLPQRLEAGTPNIAGVIGMGAALKYLMNVGMQNIADHEKDLLSYAIATLQSVDGIRLLGPAASGGHSPQSGVLSFQLDQVHPHDMATLLDEQGICIRAGHHCCQPLMRDMGLKATARASFYLYNTKEEVDRLAGALVKCRQVFSRVAR